jgi:hypothetical protein
MFKAYFISSGPCAFNEKLNAVFVYHQVGNVLFENSFIEVVPFESSSHKECSGISQDLVHNDNIQEVFARTDMGHLHVVVVKYE